MNSREYMDFVRNSRSHKYSLNLAAIALAEEAGEVCGVIKKTNIYPEFEKKYGICAKDKILEEAGDVLYQLCVVLDLCGSDIETLMASNHAKLVSRHSGERTIEDGGKRD